MVATHDEQTALKLLVDLLLKWEREGGRMEGGSGEGRVGGEGRDWGGRVKLGRGDREE